MIWDAISKETKDCSTINVTHHGFMENSDSVIDETANLVYKGNYADKYS